MGPVKLLQPKLERFEMDVQGRTMAMIASFAISMIRMKGSAGGPRPLRIIAMTIANMITPRYCDGHTDSQTPVTVIAMMIVHRN